MAKQKIKVTGLELQTKDGKKVNLTLDEAKELHEQLNELFATKYVPSQPVYIDPWWRMPYYSWTCSTAGGEVQTQSNTSDLRIKYTNGTDTAGNAY